MSKFSPFLEAVKKRRTIYKLTNDSVIPDADIKQIIETTALNVPSSFNCQSSRLLVLVKDQHEKLWDIASEVLKP